MGRFFNEHWHDIVFTLAVLFILGFLAHTLKPPEPIILHTDTGIAVPGNAPGGP